MTTTAETINGAAAGAEDAIRRKASQLQKFFDDVEELLERVSGLDEPEVERLRSRMGASIRRITMNTRDSMRAAVEGTRKAALATDQYVRAKPWVVIGATALAGVLVGALLRGSRKD